MIYPENDCYSEGRVRNPPRKKKCKHIGQFKKECWLAITHVCVDE